MNFIYSRIIFFVTALLAGGISMAANDKNTISDGADEFLMLRGKDPVSYFTQPAPVDGSRAIKADYEGATYRFASEENKAMFVGDPVRYAPQFGGFCTNGIVYGIPWGGDPDTWKMIDGKLYIFGGDASRKYFLMNEKRNLQLAHEYWLGEVKGSNGLVQRYYRLVVRVPHYKTGEQLEAEWQRSQGAKPQGLQ